MSQEIIEYTNKLTVDNIQSLPSGLGCNFLVCITSLDETTLIAKRWSRKAPKLANGEKVITFTKTAHKQAIAKNK